MRQYICYLFGLVLFACGSKDVKLPLTNEDFCAKIHRNDSISLSAELVAFEERMKSQTGVYVLEDGGGSLVTRAWLCEYAEKSIDIQYFIFSTDNVGLIAIDYLVRAANRGVKVRMLVDDILVNASLDDVLILASHENINIKIYNPGINLGKSIYGKLKKLATEFRSANQRMHNKTFIVDKNVVITGGRNVADEYFDYDHDYNFRDRDVLLLGGVTKDVHRSFEEFWNDTLSVEVTKLSGEVVKKPAAYPFDRLHQYACNPENFWPQIRNQIDDFQQTIAAVKSANELLWLDSVSFVSDVPGKNDGTSGLGGGGRTTEALINLLKNAQTSLDIQTPYLIVTEVGQKLFREAVERGVNIRILTNSLASTDNVEAFSAYQKCRQGLLEAGVKIFEFKPDAAERRRIMTGELQKTLEHSPVFGLHAKSIVVDRKTTVIGTFNLDPRSANLNTECITIMHSEVLAKNVLEGMEIEFQEDNSWETTLDWNPDEEVSRTKRLKTWTRKVLPVGIL